MCKCKVSRVEVWQGKSKKTKEGIAWMIDREPRTEVSHASLHALEVQSALSSSPAPGAMLLSVSTILPQDGTAWNISLQEAVSERGSRRRRNPIRLPLVTQA